MKPVCLVLFFFKVLNGLDVLLRNDLGAVKRQFVAQSVIGVYKDLTADQFRRFAHHARSDHLTGLLLFFFKRSRQEEQSFHVVGLCKSVQKYWGGG